MTNNLPELYSIPLLKAVTNLLYIRLHHNRTCLSTSATLCISSHFINLRGSKSPGLVSMTTTNNTCFGANSEAACLVPKDLWMLMPKETENGWWSLLLTAESSIAGCLGAGLRLVTLPLSTYQN